MSNEVQDGFDLYEDALGVQDDGKPAAVAEEEVKPKEDSPAEKEEGEKPEPEKEEEEGEDEETIIQRRKQRNGSHRARERVKSLEAENQILREQLAGKKPAGDEAQKPRDGAPKEEDFENHDDYLVAKAKHEIRQEDAARARENQAKAAKANWDAKVEAGREKFEDFDEVLADAEAPSPLLAPRLIHEKTPVEVVYYLATHPKELKEINALGDPYDVAEALAEIKAKVLAPKEPKPKPVTKAPAPLVPLKGSAAASQSDDGFEVY